MSALEEEDLDFSLVDPPKEKDKESSKVKKFFIHSKVFSL